MSSVHNDMWLSYLLPVHGLLNFANVYFIPAPGKSLKIVACLISFHASPPKITSVKVPEFFH
jgi:hypothetical protein